MITLRFGGYQPGRSVHSRGLHALAECVARRSAGGLAIEVTENVVASGHKAGDLFELVASGALDGCYFASSYLAGRVPALGVLDCRSRRGRGRRRLVALDGAGGAAAGRGGRRRHPVSRAGVLGQRHPPYQQWRAADLCAGGLCGVAPADLGQRAASGGIPGRWDSARHSSMWRSWAQQWRNGGGRRRTR